jgi:hypothetical protein
MPLTWCRRTRRPHLPGGSVVLAASPTGADRAAAPGPGATSWAAASYAPLTDDTSSPIRRRTARSPRQDTCPSVGSAPAPTPRPHIAGTERAPARAKVPPSLIPATASPRAAHDPHLAASTRQRHERLELVLAVRRAERGSSSRHTSVSSRRRRPPDEVLSRPLPPSGSGGHWHPLSRDATDRWLSVRRPVEPRGPAGGS